ncbi:hypothetical protein [Paraliomyxa miuraensis]|uniref:hypothetical protein n=1 Tax=Paraliomyxa miuraensis TaxID=376150 RepID=UPI0022537D2A|nr:hypothetical protein [Paraliomyxa miuraensis]MCX4246304.1 hypothetical protein [Paraliomyxa miuraensis]
MRRLLPSVLLCLVLLASACKGQPLPADKAEFAGRWHGVGIQLEIRPEGHVSYRKSEGRSTVTIDGPLQGWQGDDFVVGVMVVKTKFHVTEPPHLVDGKWMMTVDGVELTRVEE